MDSCCLINVHWILTTYQLRPGPIYVQYHTNFPSMVEMDESEVHATYKLYPAHMFISVYVVAIFIIISQVNSHDA